MAVILVYNQSISRVQELCIRHDLSICSQLNAFQFKDHLRRNRNAAGWVPLLLAVHPQVTDP